MLNFENFEHEIMENKPIALIIFSAEWCKPCQLQKLLVADLKEEFAKKVLIELIDVDSHEKLADKYNARTLPTTVLFAQGELIEVLPGYQTLDFLQSYLRHIILEVEKANQDKKTP